MPYESKAKNSQKGFTLIELMIVVNILAILIGAASVALSEYSYESRCLEVYNVFAQIIRSQAFHFMQYNQYYAANPNELKTHGVDLSEAVYFTYSTFICVFRPKFTSDSGLAELFQPRGTAFSNPIGNYLPKTLSSSTGPWNRQSGGPYGCPLCLPRCHASLLIRLRRCSSR